MLLSPCSPLPDSDRAKPQPCGVGRCEPLGSQIHIREADSEVSGHMHFGETKTGKSRIIVLPGFLRTDSPAHLTDQNPDDSEGFVFADSKGAPLRNSNWRRRVWNLARATSGMHDGLRIHDLRHGCFSRSVSRSPREGYPEDARPFDLQSDPGPPFCTYPQRICRPLLICSTRHFLNQKRPMHAL